jgi:hypothetical protein
MGRSVVWFSLHSQLFGGPADFDIKGGSGDFGDRTLSDEKWKHGLELEEALLETADPADRAEHDRLRQFDIPLIRLDEPESSPRNKFRRLRAQLEKALIHRLQKAELVAVGYDTRSGADSKPTIVTPDRWRVLKLDFHLSSAKASNLSLEGVLVFRDRSVLDMHLQVVDPFRSGMPGRTTAKHKIVAEFQRRVASNEALPSLAAESRELGQWLFRAYPEAPATSARTIENQLRDLHRRHFKTRTTK